MKAARRHQLKEDQYAEAVLKSLDWARDHLATRRERNDFYTQLGRCVPPGRAGLSVLQEIGVRAPGEMLVWIREG